MTMSSLSELRAERAHSPVNARTDAPHSTPGDQLAGVQVLRGIAALAVVLHHTLEEATPLFAPAHYPHALARVGACGVDLFFVISGFIMLHTNWSRIGQPLAGQDFLWRRALRIYPFYWLCLAVVAVAHAFGLFKALVFSPGSVAASLVLYPSGSRLVMPVAWTLVFEVYFYVVFALWIRVPSARGLLLGVPLTMAALGVAALLLPDSATRSFLTNPIMLEFLFGVGLAWLYRKGRRPSSPLVYSLVALALFSLASLWNPWSAPEITGGLSEHVRFFAWGVPAALMTWGWLAPLRAQGRLWRWLGLLGNASYALYLTHTFVMTSLARALKSERVAHSLPPWLAVVAAVCVSLLLAWLAHNCVEEPLNQRLRELYSRYRARRSAAALRVSKA